MLKIPSVDRNFFYLSMGFASVQICSDFSITNITYPELYKQKCSCEKIKKGVNFDFKKCFSFNLFTCLLSLLYTFRSICTKSDRGLNILSSLKLVKAQQHGVAKIKKNIFKPLIEILVLTVVKFLPLVNILRSKLTIC